MLGVYPNLSNDDYHAHDSISRSKLMDFAVSPYNYWAMHLNPSRPPRKSSAAMDIGQAYHDLWLSPEIFKESYAVEPPRVLLKDVGREAYDEYKADIEALAGSGKTILGADEQRLLQEMAGALACNVQAVELLEGAINEQSYFWKDEATGLLLKCRPDILHDNMFVDFKTTRDASPKGFQNAIAQYGYHVQAAIIQEGVMKVEGRLIENFLFLCQEKVYPYMVGIYILGEESIEVGRKQLRSLTLDLHACIINDNWPGFEPETINLPRWYL